jgi:hypothetical protein
MGVHYKTDLMEAGYENVDWINLAQHRDQLSALLTTIMKLQVPQKRGGVLSR